MTTDVTYKTLAWLSGSGQINGDEIADRLTYLEDTILDDDASDARGVDLFLPEATPDEIAELRELREIIEEVNGYSGDNIQDVTLISEESFTEHAQELAEDTGMVDRTAAWPLRHIDWAAAANELKDDYTVITIRGKDFWYR